MSDLILVQENSTPETVELISPGPQGPSGTFTIGTITTGLPGTAVNITNTGTPSQAVLNFTIPRGDVGDITPALLAAKVAAEYAATAAGGSASTATTQAGIATTQASTATAQANLATTKAADAVTAAGAALASQNTASTAATTATNQANTATTQAGIATTKASEAVTSASSASGYATAAAGSANASATSAANSSGYSSLAQEWATKTSSEVALGQGYGAKKYALDAASMAAAAEIAAAGSLVHSQTAAGHSQEASTSADNANTSASVSSDASVLATLRAGQAAESASTSSSQAANASASAATATSQASSATTSASTASTQAGIATTKASEAATSASAASVSAAAALASQTASAGSAAAANTSAGSAAGSASSALAIYGTTNAQQAALVAAQSAASLAQGFALSASSAIQQDLSGVTAQALHRSPNAVTAMFVYDTSKDSDGGAWTERCQHTSWYNEALNGKWLGSQASESSARYEGAALGSELLSSATLPWQRGFLSVNGTISASGGLITITQGSSDSSSFRWVQPITCVIGKVYRVYAQDIRSSVGTGMFALSANSAGTGITGDNSITDPQDPSARYVVATATTMYAVISLNGGSTGSTATIGNISVREVTALNTASGDYYQSTVDGKFYRLWKNLLTYSEQFDNAAWAKGNTAVTANTTVAPNGTTTADLAVVTGAGDSINRTATVDSGSIVTFSVFMQRGNHDWFRLTILNGANEIQCWYNLATGVLGTLQTAGTGTSASASMEDAGNGWYRCVISGAIPSTTSYQFINATAAANASFSRVSEGERYIWGAQLELGSTVTAYETKTTDSSVTETFRGNKADFPRLAGIVAEAASVTIYDLTEAGRPMWMRRPDSVASYPISSVVASNSILAFGRSVSNGDLLIRGFTTDTSERIGSTGNSVGAFSQAPAAFTPIVSNRKITNSTVNAVAMTVLPDAPVDAVTGLQVPTIAVATAGGVSVIRENGSVYAIRNADGANDARAVSFIGKRRIAVELYDDDRGFRLFDIPTANITQVNHYTRGSAPEWYAPNTSGNSGAGADLLFLGPLTGPVYRQAIVPISNTAFLRAVPFILNHVHIVNRNQSSPKKGVVTSITNTFNTGHLIGDIRRAYLADVAVGSVSGTELITGDSATFTSGVGTWVPQGSGGGISAVNGEGVIAAPGWVGAELNLGVLTNGKTYHISADIYSSAAGVGTVSVFNFYYGQNNGVTLTSYNTCPQVKTRFTATLSVVHPAAYVGITTYHLRVNGANPGTVYLDNISVKEAVADRSYKAQGASITGTLTKTQVAAASQLVAYSGFSAANYLREPYSADLDFGTGEWSASAWVNTVGRKNLLTYSEQFNNSAWLNNSAAISSNSAVAPDGTTTADKIVIANGVALGTSTGAGVRQQPSKSATSITYSESIYAQAAEFNSVMLFMANAAATNGTRCTFNLVTGTYSSLTSFGSGFSGAAASIEAVGGGWYRCSLTTTSDADAAIRASVLPIDTVASQGNGTSGIYVWGAQFEVGAIATDYQKVVDGTELYFLVADRSHSSGASLSVGLEGTGKLKAIAFDGTTTRTVTTTAAYNTATWIKPEAVYTTDGTLAIRVNGVEVAATRGTPLLTLNNSNAVLTIGNSFASDAPFPGSIALLKLSATVPTAEQSQWMYEQEKQMFRDGAQVTLPDSGSIVDLTYDDVTDKWIAVSATNESEWSGLVRTSVTASPAGSYTKVAAASGVQLQARSTTSPGVDITIPSYGLREELVRRSESAARLARNMVAFDYVGGFTANTTTGSTAIASVASLTYPVSYVGARISGAGIPANTTVVAVFGTTIYISAAATATASGVQISFVDFNLPVGYEAKNVLSAGATKVEGATKDFTRLFDGFKETIRFGTAPGFNVPVQIQATRSAQ